MNQTELNAILKKHKLWLNGRPSGERADLTGADFTGADLTGADFTGADFTWADFTGADLIKANLTRADFTRADLTGADLTGANLAEADFTRADLTGADLTGADFTRADLTGANLTEADVDFASWPLWCGSLKAYVDDRIAIQLLYHMLSVVQHSPYVSQEVKEALLTEGNVGIANRFHRVNECGRLSAYADI